MIPSTQSRLSASVTAMFAFSIIVTACATRITLCPNLMNTIPALRYILRFRSVDLYSLASVLRYTPIDGYFRRGNMPSRGWGMRARSVGGDMVRHSFCDWMLLLFLSVLFCWSSSQPIYAVILVGTSSVSQRGKRQRSDSGFTISTHFPNCSDQ